MSDELVYHNSPKFEEHGETAFVVEKSDHGMFDFSTKEEENKCEETAITEEKLHRSDSSSSSSSDEECKDGEKKKKTKKKKALKEKIKEKINDCKDKKEMEKIKKHEADTCVPIEKYEVAIPPPSAEVVHTTPTPALEEKRGFMEKIMEKLPGAHKKAEEEHVLPPCPSVVVAATHGEEGEHKEKKGIFEKIKEKFSGHSKSEEDKEKAKECH